MAAKKKTDGLVGILVRVTREKRDALHVVAKAQHRSMAAHVVHLIDRELAASAPAPSSAKRPRKR